MGRILETGLSGTPVLYPRTVKWKWVLRYWSSETWFGSSVTDHWWRVDASTRGVLMTRFQTVAATGYDSTWHLMVIQTRLRFAAAAVNASMTSVRHDTDLALLLSGYSPGTVYGRQWR